MECMIPLGYDDGNLLDAESIMEYHRLRRFVIFDEEMTLFLRYTKNTHFRMVHLSAFINDARVLYTDDMSIFDPIDDTRTLWKLKKEICPNTLFKSSMVMNNGTNNSITFELEYDEREDHGGVIVERTSNESEIELRTSSNIDDDDILPSFEPAFSWNNKSTGSSTLSYDGSKIQTGQVPDTSKGNVKTIKLKYPIYSLLNMRLRNTALKSEQSILSTLDFRTSKSVLNLVSTKFSSFPESGPTLHFANVQYELLNKNSQVSVKPLCPTEIPFIAHLHDSYSITYKLPHSIERSNGEALHRVRVTLQYRFPMQINNGNELSIPIKTSWETDIALKKSSSSTSHGSNANMGSRFYGLTSNHGSQRFSYPQSVSSIVNNKLNNVKFKFVNNNMKVPKGKKFVVRLQIVNSSSSPLDLVVYYNNQIPSMQPKTAALPLEKQFQVFKNYSKIASGLILLSNDYKVPIIEPSETYFVDLSFIGIVTGYYPTIAGLKIVELKTNELIELGIGASVLIY